MNRVPAPDLENDKTVRLVLRDNAVLKGIYRVRYLASGARGISYKAEKAGKFFYVKEVDTRDSRNAFSLTQEHFILTRLNHLRIVKVVEFFEQDGFVYLVTEFIPGQTLEEVISYQQEVFLEERVINGYASQLYDIFEYLHGLNPPVIYRDIKPQNIIIDTKDIVHIVDFGITSEIPKGINMELYDVPIAISPEHVQGMGMDVRSDIFNIGATLLYLSTNGRGERSSGPSPIRSINPVISEKFEAIVLKATEKDRNNRFQSVKEMREAHFGEKMFSGHSGIPSIPETLADDFLEDIPYTQSDSGAKNVFIGIAMILALILVFGWMFFFRNSGTSLPSLTPDHSIAFSPINLPFSPLVSHCEPSASPSESFHPIPTVTYGMSPKPSDLPMAPALPSLHYPQGTPLLTRKPVEYTKTPDINPSMPSPSMTQHNPEIVFWNKVDFLSMLLKIKKGSFQNPKGEARLDGIMFRSPGGYYESIIVPKGYIQVLERYDYMLKDTHVEGRVLDHNVFFSIDEDFSERSIRLLSATVFMVPEDTGSAFIYSFYIERLEKLGVKNSRYVQLKNDIGYGIEFRFKPVFSENNYKFQQIIMRSSDAGKMYVLAAGALPESFRWYIKEFTLFCNSFREKVE